MDTTTGSTYNSYPSEIRTAVRFFTTTNPPGEVLYPAATASIRSTSRLERSRVWVAFVETASATASSNVGASLNTVPLYSTVPLLFSVVSFCTTSTISKPPRAAVSVSIVGVAVRSSGASTGEADMSVAGWLGVAVVVDSLVGGEPLQPDSTIITQSEPITSRLLKLGDTVVIVSELSNVLWRYPAPFLIDT